MRHPIISRVFIATAATWITVATPNDARAQGDIPALGPTSQPWHQEGVQLLNDSKFDEAIALANKRLETNPDDPIPWILISLANLGLGDHEAATETAETHVESNPDLALKIYLESAKFYLKKGQRFRALQALDTAIDIRSEPAFHQLRGQIYASQGDLQEALAELKKIEDQVQDNSAITQLHLALGDSDSAIASAKVGAERNPTNGRARFLVGACQLLDNQPAAARASFEEAIEIDSTLSEAKLQIAYTHLAENDHAALKAAFETLPPSAKLTAEAQLGATIGKMLASADAASVKVPEMAKEPAKKTPTSYLTLAAISAYAGDTAAAQETLQRATNLFADFQSANFFNNHPIEGDPASWAELARVSFLTGLGLFETVLNAETPNPTSKTLPDQMRAALKALAATRLQREAQAKELWTAVESGNVLSAAAQLQLASLSSDDPEAEIRYCRKALERVPQASVLRLRIGNIFFKEEKLGPAIREFNKFVEAHPELPLGYNQIAWTYAELGDDLDKALKFALEGRKHGPDDLPLTDTLAWIYFKSGETQKAMETYRPILNKQITDPEILFHIAQVFEKQGDTQQANTFYERALNISDSFDGAETAKTALGF